MYVQLLGPVEASVEGRPVAIGSGKPRALLALLALHARSVVPADRLIEGLWGEEPPASAHKLVQIHVSQLRKAFAENGNAAQIVTRGQGYELDIDAAQVDARWFEHLVELGEAREALALWHGPPLHDVAGEPFAAAEIRRLEELRLTALENAIERDLAAGRHREVVGELDGLVREEPLRERLHAQRMLALYRSGRQADALDAYRQARTALVEEIGVEPGPELRRLHDEILRQDPSLHRADEAVVEAAERVAAGRPALRAAEDELVGGIVAVQAARASANGGKDVLVCPFKGLASFDVDDADFFFGRERLVAELVARQTGAPLTALVGASGSGKSSVLRAGLGGVAGRRRAAGERALGDRAAAPGGASDARPGGRDGGGRAVGSARPRRRPVRGAVHGLPRRGGARLVRRRARRVRPRPAPARRRAPGDPRRLLRALRRVSRVGAAARRQPRPRRADAARRAAAGDRAAVEPRRARGRAGGHRRAARRRRGRARRAAPAVDLAARAVAAPRRQRAAIRRLRGRRRGRGRGRAPGGARV